MKKTSERKHLPQQIHGIKKHTANKENISEYTKAQRSRDTQKRLNIDEYMNLSVIFENQPSALVLKLRLCDSDGIGATGYTSNFRLLQITSLLISF